MALVSNMKSTTFQRRIWKLVDVISADTYKNLVEYIKDVYTTEKYLAKIHIFHKFVTL